MKKLFIICGISFAGKSTLGEAIAQRFGYAQVDVDDMKFQLYGLNSKDEDLSHADWVRIYDEHPLVFRYGDQIDRWISKNISVIS